MSYDGSYTTTGSSSGLAELSTGAIIILVVFVTGFLTEGLVRVSSDRTNRFKTLVDYTASSKESSIVIRQDPKFSDAIPIGASINERTGIEFAYSFWLYVLPSTFSGDDVLKHVFHKGYAIPWPLMGPGVFIKGNSNTMRVVMNTSKNPFTFVDVKNIPVQKWFHVVLNCFRGGLDIYINGTLATRIPFKDTIPYQNFQDLVFFSQPTFTFRSANIAALETQGIETLQVAGAFDGAISSVKYARYALSMSEIQAQVNQGPSNKRKSAEIAIPPYLADSWWANARKA